MHFLQAAFKGRDSIKGRGMKGTLLRKGERKKLSKGKGNGKDSPKGGKEQIN